MTEVPEDFNLKIYTIFVDDKWICIRGAEVCCTNTKKESVEYKYISIIWNTYNHIYAKIDPEEAKCRLERSVKRR